MGLLLLMGDSGFRGALDTLGSGLESAWSVGRRLRTGYSGPIIRVRRSSDNTESDFSYLNDGSVDVTAVASFCGAGDGFLTTIYDQSGKSRNITQTTAATQPLIVSSGTATTINGKLAATFNGSTSSRSMSVPSSAAFYKCLHDGTSSTIYSVFSVDDVGANKFIFATADASVDTGAQVYLTGTEELYVTVRGGSGVLPVDVGLSGAFTTNILSLFIDADNATASQRVQAYRDSTTLANSNAQTASPSTANATRNAFMGTNSSGVAQFSGKIGELVVWSSDYISSRSIWINSSKQFWGTP